MNATKLAIGAGVLLFAVAATTYVVKIGVNHNKKPALITETKTTLVVETSQDDITTQERDLGEYGMNKTIVIFCHTVDPSLLSDDMPTKEEIIIGGVLENASLGTMTISSCRLD